MKLRVFAGMTVSEAAKALNISRTQLSSLDLRSRLASRRVRCRKLSAASRGFSKNLSDCFLPLFALHSDNEEMRVNQ